MNLNLREGTGKCLVSHLKPIGHIAFVTSCQYDCIKILCPSIHKFHSLTFKPLNAWTYLHQMLSLTHSDLIHLCVDFKQTNLTEIITPPNVIKTMISD